MVGNRFNKEIMLGGKEGKKERKYLLCISRGRDTECNILAYTGKPLTETATMT